MTPPLYKLYKKTRKMVRAGFPKSELGFNHMTFRWLLHWRSFPLILYGFHISTSFFTHFSYFYHLDVSFDSPRVGITQLSCNWEEATLTLTFSFCISVSFSFSWAYLKIWCNIWRWFIQNFPQTWLLFHIRNLLVLQNIQI